MGIKELTRFIEPCGILMTYDEYAEKYVVVDILQVIYKHCVRNNCWHENEFNQPIQSIINCINKLMKYNITPIFIFDGVSIQMKVKNKVKNDVHPSYSQTRSCEYPREKKKKFRITPQQIRVCERFIYNLGYPCLRAPHEADSQCAAMTTCVFNGISGNKKIVIDSVITDDTDTLVFGAKKIIRMLQMDMMNMIRNAFDMFVRNNKNNNCTDKFSIRKIFEMNNMCEIFEKHILNKINTDIEYDLNTIRKISNMRSITFAVRYDLDKVLEYLNQKTTIIRTQKKINNNRVFSMDNFVDMCILFGTDYQNRLGNMNVNDIFNKFVLSECELDAYINNIKKDVVISEEYIKNMKKIRNYYVDATVYEPETIDITIYKPNEKEMKDLLLQCEFNPSYINSIVNMYGRNFFNLFRKFN